MRENAKTIIDQWATPLIAVCGAVTCVNFVGLAVAFILIAGQAGQGQDARERQQAVFPVSLKLYMWASTVPESGITQRDLECFKDSKRCPTPKPAP